MSVLGYAQLLMAKKKDTLISLTKGINVALSTLTYSPSINTGGANVIVVGITDFAGSTIANVTDNKGNTYTRAVQISNATVRSALYYCLNPVVGSGHTFSYGGNANQFPSMIISVFAKTTVTSIGATATNTAAASNLVNTGNVTVGSNALIVSVANSSSNVPATSTPTSITSPYIFGTATSFAASTNFSIGLSYAEPAAGTIASTWSFAGSSALTTCALAIT